MGIWVGGITAIVQLQKFKAKPPVSFESKEQESFVKRYVEHQQHESHKPELLRKPFAA
jgi:hypothetical protein